MLQTTAAEQLHRSTEHCYRAYYDTTSVPCSEKALLQSMLQTNAAEQLHRSTEHCYRACYDTISAQCSEKALL